MKNAKTTERFSLQELLEFFRPHTIHANSTSRRTMSVCNLVPMKLRLMSGLWASKYKQTPTICKIDAGSSTPDLDTLAAIQAGADIIVDAVLRSGDSLVSAPYLLRKITPRSRKSSIAHQYEVWECTAKSPSDPVMLLELYGAAESLYQNTGAMAASVYVAVADGQQLEFDTTELKHAFDEIKRLYSSCRSTGEESAARAQVLSFRQRKTQDIQ
ncbi:MAG TPA: hypothetical protein V6C97_28430 [Oculatellaceae cyanobacterium]